MALTADDKKIYRKFLATSADRALKKLEQNKNNKKAELRKNLEVPPVPAKAEAAWKKLQAKALALKEAAEEFKKNYPDIGLTYSEAWQRSDAEVIHPNSPPSFYATDRKLRLASSAAAKILQPELEKIDAEFKEKREELFDELEKAQIAIIASDAPGIEKQLEKVRQMFDKIVEGA